MILLPSMGPNSGLRDGLSKRHFFLRMLILDPRPGFVEPLSTRTVETLYKTCLYVYCRTSPLLRQEALGVATLQALIHMPPPDKKPKKPPKGSLAHTMMLMQAHAAAGLSYVQPTFPFFGYSLCTRPPPPLFFLVFFLVAQIQCCSSP